MNRLLSTLLIGSALLGTATAVNATPLSCSGGTCATQSFSFSTPATTDFNNPVSFQLFDTSLGTLTSITISGTYGIQSQVTVTNSAASASSGSVKAEGFLQYQSTSAAIQAVLNSLIDGGSGVSNQTTTLTSTAFDLLGTQQSYTLAPGGTMTVTSNKTSGTGTFTGPIIDTTSSDFTAFEAAGGGFGNLSAATLTQTDLSNSGGNTAASQVTSGTASFTIAYTYAPTVVPEPASMAILGAGLIGAGLVRRRRASK